MAPFQAIFFHSRRFLTTLLSYLHALWFRMLALTGRASLLGADGPVVSLTSHGKRIRTVHSAIESIGRGRLRPSRLILWLSDEQRFLDLPRPLRRLQRRGLEVRFSADYGPHTKYYPYLCAHPDAQTPLVTADDDLLYPRWWLQRLVQAHQADPASLPCYRAHLTQISPDGLLPYADWPLTHSTQASFLHFFCSGPGTLFPPQIQQALLRSGSAFLSLCPRADDIWLNLHALRNGYKVRAILGEHFKLSYIPDTQEDALYHENIERGGNDRQFKATYTADELALLQTEAGLQTSSQSMENA